MNMRKLPTRFGFGFGIGIATAAAALAVLVAVGVGTGVGTGFASDARAADDPKKPAAPKPALTVTTTQLQRVSLPLRFTANGSVAAWQEASVGTEANGLRLAEVRVNVGDVVKRCSSPYT